MTQEVESNVPQGREVLRAMSFAQATVIFSESDIQDPVHTVLDAPVAANRVTELPGVTVQTGDVVSRISQDLVALTAFPFDHPDTAQARPLSLLIQIGDDHRFENGPILAYLNASVIF